MERPSVFNVVENAAKTTSRRPVAIHALRGFLSTKFPTFAQVPVNCASTSSKRGIRGQKIQRPNKTKNAGNKVTIVITATTTPIAPIGPSPRLPDRSLSNRTKRPNATVAPDATIGSKVPL